MLVYQRVIKNAFSAIPWVLHPNSPAPGSVPKKASAVSQKPGTGAFQMKVPGESCWSCVFHHGDELKELTVWAQLTVTNGITPLLFNVAMENGPFIDGLPIQNGDFPWLC